MANGARTKSQPRSRLLKRELLELQRDIRILRGGLISILGIDPEGSYRPAFVKKILRASEECPTTTFKDRKRFLASLRRR